MTSKSFSRRSFLRHSSLAALSLPLAPLAGNSMNRKNMEVEPLETHVFSKHLQFLDYPSLAATVKEIGFDGADLTVRPGGHVDPGKVEGQLPKAVEALKGKGLKIRMMTTAVTDAANPRSRKVLETAAELGFKQYRMGYYRYNDEQSIPAAMQIFQGKMAELARLNRELDLQGAYQNHAGTYVGASMWEIWQLVKDAEEGVGCQYDIRHAVVEGGRSWTTGLRLIRPWITNIVLKDFRWEQVNGKWETVNTPLGEGMVDFKTYFGILKEYGIQPAASLHLEYDLGGAEHGRRDIEVKPDKVYEAMRRDLETAQRLWRES